MILERRSRRVSDRSIMGKEVYYKIEVESEAPNPWPNGIWADLVPEFWVKRRLTYEKGLFTCHV